MSSVSPLRIGMISDIRDLLRPQALATMRDCIAVVHAGDIGNPETLDTLRSRGCSDRGNSDTAS